MIRIEKDSFSPTCSLDRDWYGWAFADGKRIGVIWHPKGEYRFVEDFDRRKHSRENRPRSIRANSIRELKTKLAGEVW